MKTLLEILVGQLDEWPEGVERITQDYDGECVGWSTYFISITDGVWHQYGFAENKAELVFKATLSSDWNTAIITKQQWLDAKK